MPRLCIVCLFLIIGSAFNFSSAQEKKNTNLLENVEVAKHAIEGEWKRTGNELTGQSDRMGRCLVPVSLGNEYRLRIEFTREQGDDVVALMVPVGDLSAVIEISGWNGTVHGLARIDELPTNAANNPTAVRPGTLENGQRQRVDLSVKQDSKNVSIEAVLNQKKLFDWSGEIDRLSPHFVFKLPDSRSLGLGVGSSRVTFHTAEVLKNGKPAAPTPTTGSMKLKLNAANPIDLQELIKTGSDLWEPFNDARFRTGLDSKSKSVAAIPNAGTGDRGAFLKNVNFSQGTIEVDLKGAAQPQSSFLGIAFNGVDGKTYDAVYFRPFNFGASDPTRRKHAIQYISHPAWPWDRLRKEKPDQYESRSQPEPQPEEWFHARVEIANRRVRVFVNESKQPAMEVELLSDRTGGKVGLWFNGIAEFRNLSITPTK